MIGALKFAPSGEGGDRARGAEPRAQVLHQDEAAADELRRRGRLAPVLVAPKTTVSGLVLVGLLALYAVIVLRTAWVCDDAYITLRTIDNFVHGFGLTWNPPDRVQTFTHPLWLFLLTPFYAITGEAFYTTMFLGLIVSVLAVVLVTRAFARSLAVALPALLVLIFSKAFVDYSTAGMENGLAHMLLALFLIAWLGGGKLRGWRGPRWLTLLAFLAALAALNRLDTLLLYLPPLALALWEVCAGGQGAGAPSVDGQSADSQRTTGRGAIALRALGCLLLGFAPLIIWEIFSVIYYGFPLPNTAYAKLSTGIPAGELIVQGLRYFLHTLRFDPLTMIAILGGMAVPFVFADAHGPRAGAVGPGGRRARAIAVAAGILLYLLYIVKIGGDFMGGRFFTAPLFAAVVLFMAGTRFSAKAPGDSPSGLPARIGPLRIGSNAIIAAAVIVVIGFAPRIGLSQALLGTGRPASRGSTAQPGTTEEEKAWPIGADGIADERAYYAIEGRALFRAKTGSGGSDRETRIFSRERGQALRAQGPGLTLEGAIGELGFNAGPKFKVLDVYGLADPLMARLPALRFDPSAALHKPEKSNWRIGHFLRTVPEGYMQTVLTGSDHLRDRKLAELYARLVLITRGPLLSRERLSEIWRMNTGGARATFDIEAYRRPTRITLAEIAAPAVPVSPVPSPPAQVDLSRTSTSRGEGTSAPAIARGDRALRFSFNGIHVVLPEVSRSSHIMASVDGSDDYVIVYYRAGEIVGVQPLTPRMPDARSLIQGNIEVPPAAAAAGFDMIGFFPLRGDGFATVGSVKLL